MSVKIITVKWEDGDVEEFMTGKSGRGTYAKFLDALSSLILAPAETPEFTHPREMLDHLEAVYRVKGELIANSGWPEAAPKL